MENEEKNTYAFNVTVSDGEFTATKPVTINVWNVNEFAPIITSGEGGSVDEYSPITTPFYDAEATDGDGDTVTFSLSGTDARLLNIDAITGVVTPLFVPGIRFDRFEQALQSGADTIIIDLEDSVSESQKEAARNNLVKFSRKSTNIFVKITLPDYNSFAYHN